MSENEQEELNPDGTKKTKINVEVRMTEEMKKAVEENAILKERIKEKELLVESLALESFGNEQRELAEAHPDAEELINLCGTPQQLEQLRAKLESGKRLPAGKSTNPNFAAGGGKEEFASQAEMLDKLYDAAYYHPEKHTKEQVDDAKTKIGHLIESMVSGPSWRTLKERGKIGEIMKHDVTACGSCGATLVNGEKCKCGYDPFKEKSKKTFVFERGSRREKGA